MPDMPARLVPGGRYSNDFAVEVADDKYNNHLPLERQARKMKSEGLDVDNQTLWDQVLALSRKLEPAWEELLRDAIRQKVVGFDETRGDSEVDGILEFRFSPNGGFDMKVLELTPGQRVRWKVVDGPREWIGTTIRFDLRQENHYTIVNFKHEGWKEPIEFMHHCSTKWAVFLLSLKSLVETGRGAPHPHDVKIDNWN